MAVEAQRRSVAATLRDSNMAGDEGSAVGLGQRRNSQVYLPADKLLSASLAEFQAFIDHEVQGESVPLRTSQQSDTAKSHDPSTLTEASASFVTSMKQALKSVRSRPLHEEEQETGFMRTENGGFANSSTKSASLDLFAELERTIEPRRLEELLEQSWADDPLVTLKIIWNARSIHLGKGERESFYRCMGWLRTHHPRTLLINLSWLCRSIIELKSAKTEESDAVVIDYADACEGPDIERDGAHGYWKDLLNLLVLDVHDQLKIDGDFAATLNVKTQSCPRGSRQAKSTIQTGKDTSAEAQLLHTNRHERREARHARVLAKLQDPFHRALHYTVARLFAEQLSQDKATLQASSASRRLSLAAKWAPSLDRMHDRQTLIATSIAEILSPLSFHESEEARALQLVQARESYRQQYLSPLRQALAVVERHISAETFHRINYSRVPSLAMQRYKWLFTSKDLDRFYDYSQRVASGQSSISGAVLTPGVLVHEVFKGDAVATMKLKIKGKPTPAQQAKILRTNEYAAQIQRNTLDGQWASLTRRIRDNGCLSSAIAVCDVSGSMTAPEFPDGTRPLDTAVGLSLLIAELTAPPFGGHMITFSHEPAMISVDGDNFVDKVQHMSRADWGMNTDFQAVFEKLILPTAIRHRVPREAMVRQVFVFSDMQFDSANVQPASSPSSFGRCQRLLGHALWETAFERLQRKFKQAGYDMPELIFWNIAGGRSAYGSSGTKRLPAPVTSTDANTALVSGYSQALLNVFLEGGSFDSLSTDDLSDSVLVDAKGVKVQMQEVSESKTHTPMSRLLQAVGHNAYADLRVVD